MTWIARESLQLLMSTEWCLARFIAGRAVHGWTLVHIVQTNLLCDSTIAVQCILFIAPRRVATLGELALNALTSGKKMKGFRTQ